MDYIKLKDNEGLYNFYTDYVVSGIGISFDYPEIKVHTESGRVISYTIEKDLDGGPAVVIKNEFSIEKFRKLYAD